MSARPDLSGDLFSEVGPPIDIAVGTGTADSPDDAAAAASVLVDARAAPDDPASCIEARIASGPASPKIERARFWAHEMSLATTPEAKAECHRKMIQALKANEGEIRK